MARHSRCLEQDGTGIFFVWDGNFFSDIVTYTTFYSEEACMKKFEGERYGGEETGPDLGQH